MSKRFTPDVRLKVYRYLCERDGEKCSECGLVPSDKPEYLGPGVFGHPRKPASLDIHHCDGDPKNNNISNLKLLCHKCNTSISNKLRAGKINVSCERKKMQPQWEGQPATRIVRQIVNYSTGETSMQANNLFEVSFREWLLRKAREDGYIPKEEAINSGAEIVGCSTETARRYVDKLTSSAGPLIEQKDLLGKIMLTWREDDSHCEDAKEEPLSSADKKQKNSSSPQNQGEKPL